MVAEVRRLLRTCKVCQMAKPEGNPPPSDQQGHSKYVQRLVDRLEEAHALLREQQITMKQNDSEKPPTPPPPSPVPDW